MNFLSPRKSHTHTCTHARTKKGFFTQTVRVNPEVKSSRSGPGRSWYVPCTRPHIQICFRSLGTAKRSRLGPLQHVHVSLGDSSLDTCRQGQGVTIPSSSPAATAPAPCTWLRGTGRTRSGPGNGISNWEAAIGANGMATTVKLGHLQLKPEVL